MNWESQYQRLVKAKYTKRTGGPGNYKYEYGDKGSGSSTTSRPEPTGDMRLTARLSEGAKFDENGDFTKETMVNFISKFPRLSAAGHRAQAESSWKDMRDAGPKDAKAHIRMAYLHDAASKELAGDRSMEDASDMDFGEAEYYRQKDSDPAQKSLYARLVKAKYTKRTGGPGNYKYEYGTPGDGGGAGKYPDSPWIKTPEDEAKLKQRVANALNDPSNAAVRNGTLDQVTESLRWDDDITAPEELIKEAYDSGMVNGSLKKDKEFKPQPAEFGGEIEFGGEMATRNSTPAELDAMADREHAEQQAREEDSAISQQLWAEKDSAKSVASAGRKNMGNLFDGWMTKGFPEDMGDDGMEEEEVDDGTEEEEEAEKGALGSGYGAGMSQGAGYASSPGGGGAAAVQSAPGAISTVAGSGASKPAASAQPASSAPSAAPKQTTGSGGGSGIGATAKALEPQDADDYMNHGSGSCSACQAGTCPHGTKKALTARSIAVPFYLRAGIQGYDPEGIRRSATAQTSSQYSSIAPQVRESMAIQENLSNARATTEATHKCAAHGVTYKSQNCPLCSTAKSLGATRQDIRYGSGGNR